MNAGAGQVHVQNGEIKADGHARLGNQLGNLLVGQVVQRDFAFQNPAAVLLVAHGRGLVIVKDKLVAVFALRGIALVVGYHAAVHKIEKVIFVGGLHDAPVGRLIGGAVGVGLGVGAQEQDDGVQLVEGEAFAVDKGRVILDPRADVEVFLVPHGVDFHGAVLDAVPVLNLIDNLRFAVNGQAARQIPFAQIAVDDDVLSPGRFQVPVGIRKRGTGYAQSQHKQQAQPFQRFYGFHVQ